MNIRKFHKPFFGQLEAQNSTSAISSLRNVNPGQLEAPSNDFCGPSRPTEYLFKSINILQTDYSNPAGNSPTDGRGAPCDESDRTGEHQHIQTVAEAVEAAGDGLAATAKNDGQTALPFLLKSLITTDNPVLFPLSFYQSPRYQIIDWFWLFVCVGKREGRV